MLLIFFNTVMFLLAILALKKIISAFVYTMDVEPLIAWVTSCKVICNLSVFTASSTLRILLITFCVSIIVFCFFFFCSWFFRWYVLPVSLSTTSSNAATSLSNSASCFYSIALFFLLFFCWFPLLSFILPFLSGFFCLRFFWNFLVVYLNVLVTG